jgi:hypothetical protein
MSGTRKLLFKAERFGSLFKILNIFESQVFARPDTSFAFAGHGLCGVSKLQYKGGTSGWGFYIMFSMNNHLLHPQEFTGTERT